MSEYFLKHIDIIDYKCFKNFKARDFKRINLISGKNNVGKTAFMEALYININSINIGIFAETIASVKARRNNLEYLNKTYTQRDKVEYLEETGNLNIKTNIKDTEVKIDNINGIKNYTFKIDESSHIINKNDFSFEENFNKNFNYIDNFGMTNNELKNTFEEVQKQDKEESLYKFINEFDTSILNFKVLGGDKPACKTIYSSQYREINEFGDGLKHFISIICSLYASRNGYLFIDEIDNGIHYTQLERLWEIIFTISKEVNCQVFATTHSREMINAYAKVSQKLEEEDISFIELGRNKENEIKANVYDKEMFLYEINQNHEVRGW